jgi:hypothetical protein
VIEEKTKSFDEILAEAVDEGLKTLGESGKHMIFFYLEKTSPLKKMKFPKIQKHSPKGLRKYSKQAPQYLRNLS